MSFYHNFYNRAISTFSQHPVDRIPKLYKPCQYLPNEHCWKDAAEKQKLHQYWIQNAFKMYKPEVCYVVKTCLATCLPTARILLSPKPDCNQLLKQNIKYLLKQKTLFIWSKDVNHLSGTKQKVKSIVNFTYRMLFVMKI